MGYRDRGVVSTKRRQAVLSMSCELELLYQRPRELTHIVDSQRARFLTPLAWGDSRHAISGQIARGLFG